VATEYKARKEGYVQGYRIEGTLTPAADTYYFEVSISSDETGSVRIQTWGLPRNYISDVLDLTPTEKRYAVSYSNTHQAIIATVKDALHNGNKVLFEGISLGPPEPPFGDFDVTPDLPIDNVNELPGATEEPPGQGRFPIEVDDDAGVAVDPPRRVEDDLPGFELRQVTIYK
jgi:hypothetical protein